jgi:hypothetical protein
MMRLQSSRHASRAACLSRLSASLLMIGLLWGEVRAAEPSPPDEELRRTMAAISEAFRAGNPEPLTSLLPEGSKVFISLEHFQGNAGYYGRDQVYFILREMFSDLRTVRFNLRQQSGVGNPPPRGQKPSQTAHCVGDWKYSRQQGPETDTQMLFVLYQKNSRWSITQLREAR